MEESIYSYGNNSTSFARFAFRTLARFDFFPREKRRKKCEKRRNCAIFGDVVFVGGLETLVLVIAPLLRDRALLICSISDNPPPRRMGGLGGPGGGGGPSYDCGEEGDVEILG